MSALAAIHVAKKQLGLDEDTYRAVLVRITGKDSAKVMSEPERQAVVEELRRQGFKATSKPRRRGLEGRFAKKLQALWIAAGNLGIIDNRDDRALLAFVKRQTGIDHTRFLRHPEDAAKAIEALKAWMAREAGVDWSADKLAPDHMREPGFKIATAQFAILKRLDPAFADVNSLRHWMAEYRASIGGHSMERDARGWQPVMNALGVEIRQAILRQVQEEGAEQP